MVLSLKTLSAFAALGCLALVAGSVSARADVTTEFGALTPSPGGCTHSGTDEGLVCNNSQTFTNNGSTFTATGYSGTFATPTALTLKPVTGGPLAPPTNAFDESGLGENATGAGTACTDTSTPLDCEIGPATSVTVTSSSPMDDIVIGSAQTGESADVYTFSGGVPTLLATVVGGSCTTYMGDAATCYLNGFSTDEIGVVDLPNAASSGTSDTLIVAVSQPSSTVPEPASLALLATALVGLGLLQRRRASW